MIPLASRTIPNAHVAVAQIARRSPRAETGRSRQPDRAAAERDDARHRGRDERRPHRPIRPEQRQQDRPGGRGGAVGRVGDPDRGRPRDPVVGHGHPGQRDRQRDARGRETDHPADHEDRAIGHEQADDRGHEHRREGAEEQPASTVRVAEHAADQEQAATDDRRQEQQDLGLAVLPDRGLDRARDPAKRPAGPGPRRTATGWRCRESGRRRARDRGRAGSSGSTVGPLRRMLLAGTSLASGQLGSVRGIGHVPAEPLRGRSAGRRRGPSRGRSGRRCGPRRAP